MKLPDDEDLFEKTKMSFGDHLEELRGALGKSLLALALGFLLGMWWGGSVVDYVQIPLRASLETLRKKQIAEEFAERVETLKSHGVDLATAEPPKGEQRDPTLVPRVRYFDPAQLAQALGIQGLGVQPAPPGEGAAEPAKPPRLVPLTVFEPISDDPRTHTIGTGVSDAFGVYVQASLVVGAVLSGPFIFYFLWNFVASGLYRHERKMVYVYMPISIGLFLAGAGIAFFFALPIVIDFLFVFNDWMKIDPTPRISEWLSFVLMLPLGFGISFQLPLVMLFLERIGVFRTEDYIKQWRIAVVVICAISVVLTPADVYSMMLMAVPLCVLYFGGVALCRYMPRPKSPFGEPLDAPTPLATTPSR